MTKTLRLGTTALLACTGLVLARPAQCQLRGAPEGFVGAGSSLFGAVGAAQTGFQPTAPRTLESWAAHQTLRFAVAQLSSRALTPTLRPAMAVERMTALQSTLAVDLRPEPVSAAMAEPMAVVRDIRSLPVRFGYANAMQHFSGRQSLERVLGTRGRSGLYRIGLQFDF
jgi:hypothetical protein